MGLLIKFDTPDQGPSTVWLRSTTHPTALSFAGNSVIFNLVGNQSVYLTSTGNASFATPPAERLFVLRPDSDYALSGEVSVDGPSPSLWLIEYDDHQRLTHETRRLKSGPFELNWRTHPQHKSACLAVRLTGVGRLRLGNLKLQLRSSDDVVQKARPASGRGWGSGGSVTPPQRRSFADAYMRMGECRCPDLEIVDCGPDEFAALLDRHDIGPALVMPFGENRRLDTFDQVCQVAARQPGRVFPVFRWRAPDRVTEPNVFSYRQQVELLWQTGRLYGLAFDLRDGKRAPEAVLRWAQQRKLVTFWQAHLSQEWAWLESNVLPRFSNPMLILLRFEGSVHEAVARLSTHLSLFPHCYAVFDTPDMISRAQPMLQRSARQILLGSASPDGEPTAMLRAVERLDVPPESKDMIRGDNLTHLLAGVQAARGRLLANSDDLLFPPVPETREQLAAQGFDVLPPGQFPVDEAAAAKTVWAGWQIKSWYQRDKPWAQLLADLVYDLQPKSVLEFGCNVGRNLAAIARALPDLRLTGIDINAEAVRLGCEHTGLDLRVGDEKTLAEFREGEFDLVFTVSVLDHIPDIADVCRLLIRCAARHLFCLEVRLPAEGRVIRHYDHKRGAVVASTQASYSWHLERFIHGHPRLWRLDHRPCYLHSAALGPYYYSYLAFLDPPPPVT